MKTIDRVEFHDVIQSNWGPCISMFVPGSQTHGEEARPRIRLKVLLREAEWQLEQHCCPHDTIRELTAPIYDLAEQLDWPYQSLSLALFRAAGFFRYHAAPFEVPETVVVADGFYLAPLFRIAEADQRFYLLELSQTGAKLFEAGAGSVSLAPDVAFPASPVAPVDKRGSQARRRFDRSWSRGFGILHRHRNRDENRKQEILGWFRQVDDVLRAKLGAEGAPVVLVSVQYLCPMYRHISRYENLAEGEIHGSSEGITVEQLWQRGRDITSTSFQQKRQQSINQYLRLWHTGRASNDVRDIEAAARRGRIEALFVANRGHGWLHVQPTDGHLPLQPEPDSRDLIDLAALNTFMTGGTVYAVPRPHAWPGSRSRRLSILRGKIR